MTKVTIDHDENQKIIKEFEINIREKDEEIRAVKQNYESALNHV